MYVWRALTTKLKQFANFDEHDLILLKRLMSGTRSVPAKTNILEEGQCGHRSFIMMEGWGYCYKDLADGGRQIVNFQLSGDVVGVRSMLLHSSDHSFSTLTPCTVVEIKRQQWEELFAASHRIGMALMWAMAREESMIVEHLVNLGRRSARQRTAHLLCELGHRLEILGLVKDNAFTCPVSQPVLADALGLSVVHLNRTLRELRERGLVHVKVGGTYVVDFEALMELAEFDGDYLGLTRLAVPA